eukprot:753025-Hanusia_phi.AAC.2
MASASLSMLFAVASATVRRQQTRRAGAKARARASARRGRRRKFVSQIKQDKAESHTPTRMASASPRAWLTRS